MRGSERRGEGVARGDAAQIYEITVVLKKVVVEKHGDGTAVTTCGVSVDVMHQDTSVLDAFPGGAKLISADTPSQLSVAAHDCVVAIVSDLVGKRLLPTIEQQAALAVAPGADIPGQSP